MNKTYKIVKKGTFNSDLHSETARRLRKDVESIKRRYGVDDTQLIEFITRKEILVPVSIFKNKLSPFEALVVFLLAEERLRIAETARRLNRSYTTVYSTYRNARKKKTKLHLRSKIYIPLKEFSKERLSVLETLIMYLKDEEGMRFKQIAMLLNKHPNTVWTCYSRAIKKGGGGNV